MPHIVFGDRIDLNDFSKKFSPIFKKEPVLIKIQTIFVDKDGLTALLPTVVISDIHQQFLIEISTRKDKTTIRLYPNTDPEKTDGVKLSMALLAAQIMQVYPDFNITKTNLSDYLGMVKIS
ncbi:hypothetical protein Nisw_08570 [Candidatus Nitrosopumilus sp. SW]|uniref:hypothetical protein n=1 Tax=Candidatus Nitrosopumilus sp. SW TaxID=2508726 RepID=UPI00114DCFD4|nr:hypothetical protein [Candidatus Nitrosopumilus sp. SW]QDI89567.1 hypothetical protein Nisw_08570 [Candidatus Nitrosopumilus sp. SW]